MSIQHENISNGNFEECIKCTICTVYCPVTVVNPDYPGPKQSGPDGERYRLKKPLFYDEGLKYCLNCKRCEVACPSEVKIGDLILNARIKYTRSKPSLRDTVLASTDLMGTVAGTFAPIVNGMLRLKPVKYLMDGVIGIDRHRQFPTYSGRPFTTWFNHEARQEQTKYEKQVTYFHGCYVQYNFPQLGKDLVKVLNALGYGVQLLEKEKCCGVAKLSNRLVKAARRDAQLNIESIRKAVGKGNDVVGTSSTCIFTMRDEYPHVLEIDNSDVREHIMLATRFIFRLIDEKGLKLVFRNNYHRRVAYHTPCHMAKLGWTVYSTQLLRMIPGLDFVMLDSNCCGIAGTYGFKKEYYNYSQQIGQPLFHQILNEHVDCVATDCETCKWQIEMSTGLPVENPISILADALDYEATQQGNYSAKGGTPSQHSIL
ncbi:MAG: anaerobic glycerol-3-phosphate dehydrogenase subunit GlpC, partial [Muribaculum sp.]|nr:anaerobic glycerol-3-phosphate dehydrogenase subunit GlpC [Muribaculaceae bacterium]MCM1081681.1 anaerobic glycerol-3-phosphate dehydrogenase subunit GlpC [Muribaculum sp.]